MGKWSREATSLLIEEVKKLPFLYDPISEGYHDRRARKSAMHDISTIISEIRPGTSSEEVRIRWSALRSAFQGSLSKLKRQRNGLGSEFTKVWYFDDMLFLLDLRTQKNGFLYTTYDGGETLDTSTQNEDAYRPVSVAEETMDVPLNEVHLSEALPPERYSRKCVIGKNLQMGNLHRKDHQREDHQRDDHQRDDHQRDDHQRDDHQRDDHQRDDHQREDHQREVHQREVHQREVLERENLQRENLQRENLQRETLQRENHERENLQRDFPREDHCVTDALTDRSCAENSGERRRKRNYEVAFYHTLDYAVKKLMDRATEDADVVFGKLVTHELKSLNSPILRKKLKHKILQNIIEIQNLQD